MTFEAMSPAESSVVQGAPISEEADQGLSPWILVGLAVRSSFFPHYL